MMTAKEYRQFNKSCEDCRVMREADKIRNSQKRLNNASHPDVVRLVKQDERFWKKANKRVRNRTSKPHPDACSSTGL